MLYYYENDQKTPFIDDSSSSLDLREVIFLKAIWLELLELEEVEVEVKLSLEIIA
jgi:hypothetical protein